MPLPFKRKEAVAGSLEILAKTKSPEQLRQA
jgi:hypothetical protein